jgi:hypothetical protein
MSDLCPPTIPRKVAANRDGTRRRLFLGLAAFTLIKAGEVMAADQVGNTTIALRPDLFAAQPPLSAALLPIPREYTLPPAFEPRSFSNTEFRPRGHSVFDSDRSIPGAWGGDNLMSDRTVWQRLQEYRSHDRVRVLTLWESGASAVSIQTNRKGDPSLQWTSRLMNRGGATRGLLDRWMPVSVFRSFSRPAVAASGKAPAVRLPETGRSP